MLDELNVFTRSTIQPIKLKKTTHAIPKEVIQ